MAQTRPSPTLFRGFTRLGRFLAPYGMRQNPHVWICGGPGSATTLVYPTPPGHWYRGGPLGTLVKWPMCEDPARRCVPATRAMIGS